MERVLISFRHYGNKVTLRALVTYKSELHPVLTKHKCNSTTSLETINNYLFIMFFRFRGKYSYAACGYLGKGYLRLSYVCPYNNNTGLFEEEVVQSTGLKRVNW